MLVSLLRALSVINPVTCLGTALFRVCACAASSRVTWAETVRSPGVRPVPVPVLLCLLRLRLFPLLSFCRPPCRLRCHLYPLSLSSLRLCNPFCNPLLSRPLLCLLLCHLSSLRKLLLLKMGKLLCLPLIRKLMPLHHGVLVHVFLLPLIIRNLSFLSSQTWFRSVYCRKVVLSMIKAHKLSVSDDECARVAASVCSNSCCLNVLLCLL